MAGCGPNSLSILGIPVTDVDSSDDVVQFIKERIGSHEPTFCVAINPEKVHRAARLSQVSL